MSFTRRSSKTNPAVGTGGSSTKLYSLGNGRRSAMKEIDPANLGSANATTDPATRVQVFTFPSRSSANPTCLNRASAHSMLFVLRAFLTVESWSPKYGFKYGAIRYWSSVRGRFLSFSSMAKSALGFLALHSLAPSGSKPNPWRPPSPNKVQSSLYLPNDAQAPPATRSLSRKALSSSTAKWT